MRGVLLLVLVLQIWACSLPARYQKNNDDTKARVLSASFNRENTDLLNAIDTWLGTPYVFGGTDRAGVDCSGFTSIIFAEVYNLKIPRTARDQYLQGERLRVGDLQTGDLIFFRGIRSRGVDHVGIYVGNNRFAHATESAGVTLSELSESYYQERFCGARRYISD